MKVDLLAEVPGVGPVKITGTVDDGTSDGWPVPGFLASLDPGEVERIALARLEMGSGTFAQEFMAVLIAIAEGRSPEEP